MLLEKSLKPWICVSLFGVAVSLIPLTDRLWRWPAPLPRTMTELDARLSRCRPHLHVVPQFPERPEGSIWICTQPRSREQLWGLMRDPQRVKTGP